MNEFKNLKEKFQLIINDGRGIKMFIFALTATVPFLAAAAVTQVTTLPVPGTTFEYEVTAKLSCDQVLAEEGASHGSRRVSILCKSLVIPVAELEIANLVSADVKIDFNMSDLSAFKNQFLALYQKVPTTAEYETQTLYEASLGLPKTDGSGFGKFLGTGVTILMRCDQVNASKSDCDKQELKKLAILFLEGLSKSPIHAAILPKTSTGDQAEDTDGCSLGTSLCGG